VRLIVASGAALALVVTFGLGVVVGKFVLSPNQPLASAPTNAIMGPVGLDNPLADPDAVLSTDPSVTAPAPPAVPEPPTTGPNEVVIPTPGPLVNGIGPRAESDAAMAAGNVVQQCDIKVSQPIAIRTWKAPDRVTIMALGNECASGNIRVTLETNEGRALYTLQAPARDFGIPATATADQIRDRLTTLLPANAVKSDTYPAWPEGVESPTRSEFTRETYEAIRQADAPVVCLKLPTSAQRCVAQDPKSGQLRVFARG
jgi:hypothetical protein